MNQCVMPTAPVFIGARKTNQFNIYEPQSCSGEAAKVANLRAQLKELEALERDVDTISEDIQFWSRAELVTAIVMETSIGFLDLSAAMLDSVNPYASKVAKAGMASVKSAKSLGELHTGQKTRSQVATELAQNALDAASPDNKAAKAMLHVAKTQVGAVKLAVESHNGASQEEMSKNVADFAKAQGKGQWDLVADGLEGSKSGGVMKAASQFESVITATQNYRAALDKRFDTHLNNTIQARQSAQVQKQNLRHLIKLIQERLNEATAVLNNCMQGSDNAANMSMSL